MDKFVDVHGMDLLNAQKVIKAQINEAYQLGKCVININHGFNHGKKIKTWCLKEVQFLPHVLKVDSGMNEGITKIYIECDFFK